MASVSPEPRTTDEPSVATTTSGRIVLFGATGYTGDLTAREMARRGIRPVLAGRGQARLDALASELGGLEVAVADVSDPGTVAALIGEGDVLVSTVGPFARWGKPALEAAISKHAHYLDSTGEGSFIRHVFENAGPRAEAAGVGLLTAMGYDWVPGNLAGAMALRDAGEGARRVKVAYFIVAEPEAGQVAGGMSGGTRASAAGALLDPAFSFRGGRIVTERGAKRLAHFETGSGGTKPAISVGTSEHFALPRLSSSIDEVDVYLGWFGPASRPMQAFAAGSALATKLPGVRSGVGAVASKLVKGSTGGPDAAARSRSRSLIVATAHDEHGTDLSRVILEGPNGYDLTAAFLAWGAERAAAGQLRGSGALGPVDGFGLDELETAAAEYGLTRA